MAVTTLNLGYTPEKGINYTHTTSGSTDWSSVNNSTYFYDLNDKIVRYKDSSGNVIGLFESMYSLSANSSVIHFTGNTVFGTYSSPISSNLTDTLTNAKLGVVQKIYHNSGTAPTVPAGWVLLGSTTYQTSTVNIIYAEWSEGTRVEYWIVR